MDEFEVNNSCSVVIIPLFWPSETLGLIQPLYGLTMWLHNLRPPLLLAGRHQQPECRARNPRLHNPHSTTAARTHDWRLLYQANQHLNRIQLKQLVQAIPTAACCWHAKNQSYGCAGNPWATHAAKSATGTWHRAAYGFASAFVLLSW